MVIMRPQHDFRCVGISAADDHRHIVCRVAPRARKKSLRKVEISRMQRLHGILQMERHDSIIPKRLASRLLHHPRQHTRRTQIAAAGGTASGHRVGTQRLDSLIHGLTVTHHGRPHGTSYKYCPAEKCGNGRRDHSRSKTNHILYTLFICLTLHRHKKSRT